MADPLERAIKWARKRHHGSWREGQAPLPYFTHVIDVLNILRYEAGETSEHALVASVLHDLIEDTETTLSAVEARFGEEVARLVGELTRTEPLPEIASGLDAADLRALRSHLLLKDIASMSGPAQKIKLCDRLSNLRAASRTRTGEALDRYIVQTRSILDLVSRDLCPTVWDSIDSRCATHGAVR